MMRRREMQAGLGLLLLLVLLPAWRTLSAQAGGAPKPPEGLTTPAQATAMSMFELPNANGDEPVRSEALRGKVVVIRFWASW